jgi:hypothetical protein
MRVLLRRGDERGFVGGGRTKERRILLVAALAMRQIGEMLARRCPLRNRGLDEGRLTVRCQRAYDRTNGSQGTETLGQPGPAGLGLLDVAPAQVNLQLLLAHGLTLASGRAVAPGGPAPA